MGHRIFLAMIVISIPWLGMSVGGVALAQGPANSLRANWNEREAIDQPPPSSSAISNLPFETGAEPEIPADVQMALNSVNQRNDRNVQVAAVSANDSSGDLAPLQGMLTALRQDQSWGNRGDGAGSVSLSQRLEHSDLESGVMANRDRAVASQESKPVVPAKSKFDSSRISKMLKSLAINTCIVMCVGVGVILIAKQWFKNKKPVQRGADTTIQIKSTLRLGPKANLFLIEAGEHRLMVASDQNGIKSVVPLTDSFSNTLDSLSDLADDVTADAGSSESGERQSDLYSLATVGDRGDQATSDADRRQQHSENEIRRKMEKALGEHGLKELFLQTLQSTR